MGFYIRKSVKAGPFRFNFSKSGIGVSAGVKGFRVGTGPAGNYVHMGAGGLYYRKTFKAPSQNKNTKNNFSNVPSFVNNEPSNSQYGEFIEIESGDTNQITDSSSAELLAEFDRKKKKIRFWPATAALFFLVPFFCVPPNAEDWVYLLTLFLGVIFTGIAYQYDKIRKTVVLFYEIEDEFEIAYNKLNEEFSRLQSINRKWHIESKAKVLDQKRNAGADQVVRRKVINLSTEKAPYIKTNIKVPTIPVGKQTLYFFPDRVLVFEQRKVGAVSYENLNIEILSSQFIENERVPSDAQIVDHTWRFVNKKGGPDRRFNNNKQIPICLYENVYFTSSSGLNEMVSFSKCGLSILFANALRGLSSVIGGTSERGALLEKVI